METTFRPSRVFHTVLYLNDAPLVWVISFVYV